MSLLSSGQMVRVENSQQECRIVKFLGGGGQGEVFSADLAGSPVAVKWYYPYYLQQDSGLRNRLKKSVQGGAPNSCFLWPEGVVESSGVPGFGYMMGLREDRFCGLQDLMAGRVDAKFSTLATFGFELSNAFLQLHSRGLCYRDISFGNAFFDPKNGEARICDNDNVDIDNTEGAVGGTPDFMAPEVVRCEKQPSQHTDLHSLAVLLFYILCIHHPLEGRRKLSIHSFDLIARRKLFGDEPLFIFDPVDKSNEAVSLAEDPTGDAGGQAVVYWPVYPKYLRDLFTQAFTSGLRNVNQRVRETEWRRAMIQLRDSITYCPHCGKENFYCSDALRGNGGQPLPCIHCKGSMILPPRLRLGNSVVLLNANTKLYPHHVDSERAYDFSKPIAEVRQNPTDPTRWGLTNIGEARWTLTSPSGALNDVEVGKTVAFVSGLKIQFGKSEGEIRVNA